MDKVGALNKLVASSVLFVGAFSPPAAGAASDLDPRQVQDRILLFSGGARMPTAVATETGRIALPRPSAAASSSTVELFRRADSGTRTRLVHGAHELVQAVAGGGDASRALGALCGPYLAATGERDVDSIVQGLMALASSSVEADLYEIAQQVQGEAESIKQLREQLADLRDILASWGTVDTRSVQWTDAKGVRHNENLTKEQLESVVGELESWLATMRREAEQSQLQLQGSVKRANRLLQLLPQSSRQWHIAVSAAIGR